MFEWKNKFTFHSCYKVFFYKFDDPRLYNILFLFLLFRRTHCGEVISRIPCIKLALQITLHSILLSGFRKKIMKPVIITCPSRKYRKRFITYISLYYILFIRYILSKKKDFRQVCCRHLFLSRICVGSGYQVSLT